MALINGIIPVSNMELVRDRIGTILATELANQAALTSNTDLNPEIYVERFIPIGFAEGNVINICLSGGPYDNKDATQVDGNYTYNIDFYCNASTTDEKTGDVLATIKLHRLMAVVRAILENPVYRTLGYDAPFNCSAGVVSISIADPVNNGDATHQIQGRLEYVVRVPETVELKEALPIGTHLTQVKLYETDKGYRYEWSTLMSVPITSTTSSFTLPAAYTGMEVVIVSDGTQSYSSGFTQSGDTITMTNGAVFTNGMTVVLTLRLRDYTTQITIASAGSIIILPEAYSGKTINLVFDGTQTYTSEFFTQSGLIITMTNGVTFTVGQQVTIWYGVQLVTVTAAAGNTFILPAQYRNFEQVLVNDGSQSYSSGYSEPEVITTMTNGVTFTEGQQLIIAVR